MSGVPGKNGAHGRVQGLPLWMRRVRAGEGMKKPPRIFRGSCFVSLFGGAGVELGPGGICLYQYGALVEGGDELVRRGVYRLFVGVA